MGVEEREEGEVREREGEKEETRRGKVVFSNLENTALRKLNIFLNFKLCCRSHHF